MTEKLKITFICTGGTIDKDYASCAGTYNFDIMDPAVGVILERVNPNFEYEIKSVLKKDSLDMDDNDRQKVFDECSKTENNKIIITHGTDTMVNTAEKLKTIKKKVIILVGAAKPEKFHDSDAAFNIGTSVGAINILDNGIYITMNGRIYPWDQVKKNKDTGQFQDT